MSKALICDRCKVPFSEQAALSLDAKWLFTHTHYDLCPLCRNEFNQFMKGASLSSGEEDSDNATC